MIYTNSPVITRHITPQKAAFEHYFGGLTHRTRFCMVIIHMIYKHFINQKLFRTLVPLCGGGDSNGKHALKPHTVAVSVV